MNNLTESETFLIKIRILSITKNNKYMFKRIRIKFQSPIKIWIEPDYLKETKKALREGRRLLAVKIYKEGSGLGLKDAKEFVTAIFFIKKPR